MQQHISYRYNAMKSRLSLVQVSARYAPDIIHHTPHATKYTYTTHTPQHSLYRTHHLPLTTYYSPHAICYSPQTMCPTRHTPLTTRHIPRVPRTKYHADEATGGQQSGAAQEPEPPTAAAEGTSGDGYGQEVRIRRGEGGREGGREGGAQGSRANWVWGGGISGLFCRSCMW